LRVFCFIAFFHLLRLNCLDFLVEKRKKKLVVIREGIHFLLHCNGTAKEKKRLLMRAGCLTQQHASHSYSYSILFLPLSSAKELPLFFARLSVFLLLAFDRFYFFIYIFAFCIACHTQNFFFATVPIFPYQFYNRVLSLPVF
jgi:hypothetical protein